MLMRIVGTDLPGRSACSDGGVLDAVHVAVQVRKDPFEPIPGDATEARWHVDVGVVETPDGALDFRGPAVHGRRGQRFLYLTWGDVVGDEFRMFRRAKLMLGAVDPALVRAAEAGDGDLIATVDLTDERGGPRCARVEPPAITWTLAPAR